MISNVTFDSCAAPELDPRRGGEVDDEVLRKVFTELDYLVKVHRDLTAQVTTVYLANLFSTKKQLNATAWKPLGTCSSVFIRVLLPPQILSRA